jgi:glycosyltransferase involved in cell wall biosynthesis
MKLLRVIPSLDPQGGGPVEAARTVDQELLRQGHTVEVVCLDAPGLDFASSYPAQVHALGPSRFGYRYNSQLVSWLRDNRQRFDAVVVDGLWQYHAFGVWRALAGTKTPYFVFTHGMLDPWFKRTYPLKHLKKMLYWPWAEYRVLRDAQAVLFTCEEERLLARQAFFLYHCNEAVTAFGTSVPPANAAALSEHFLSQYPNLRNKRLLLYLSRIHEKKGCDLLVDAFAKIASGDSDIHLVMAGPDQTGWVAKLKDQAERLGIADRITWPGMLQGDLKWGAFYAAEAFCLPSHQENFGIVVAEALACGKPVLISNKVNIWREIEVDGAGIVQDDTLEGTIRGLEQWLALTPQDKQKMQQSARRSFDARFRIDRVVESLINILQEGMAANASSHGLDAGVELT